MSHSIDYRHRNKQWLIEEYINKQKSVRELSRETRKSRNTIKIWLRKFAIPIRQSDNEIVKRQKIISGERHPKRDGKGKFV